MARGSGHAGTAGTAPLGAAARTVLGKIEIVLLRTGEDDYRVECWRSFSPYTFGLLAEGAEDVGL